MIYKYQFQYKSPNSARPYDEAIHEEEFISEKGEFIPCPIPGDSVTIGGNAYKVITRHFSYFKEFCYVNIVVTDLEPNEHRARIKE